MNMLIKIYLCICQVLFFLELLEIIDIAPCHVGILVVIYRRFGASRIGASLQ